MIAGLGDVDFEFVSILATPNQFIEIYRGWNMILSPNRISPAIFAKANGTPIGHYAISVVIIATHRSHLAAIR